MKGQGRQPNNRSNICYSGGEWHGFVSMGRNIDTGRPVRKHVRGRTKTEVASKVEELERQRDAAIGKAAFSGKLTVKEWADQWLLLVKSQRRVRTWEEYTGQFRRYIGPVSHVPLTELNVMQVDRLLGKIAADVSPQTAANFHRVFRACLSVAVKKGLITANACKVATVPRVEVAEVEPFGIADAQKILTVTADLRNGARWTLALGLGLRQGEALGLKWCDVDLEAGTIRVRRQLQRHAWQHGCGDEPCGRKAPRCPKRHSGGLVLVPFAKTASGSRTLQLDPVLVDQFRQHRKAQNKERLLAGERWVDGDFVFARTNGQPLSPSMDANEWHRILGAAGVPAKRLHDARHTAASVLLAMGVDGRVVMQILGWSQASLLTRYQHVSAELGLEAVSKVTSVLYGKPASNSEKDAR